MLQRFAHRAEFGSATIVSRRTGLSCRQDARLSKVVRVNKLIDVQSAIENGHVVTLANPLKENLKILLKLLVLLSKKKKNAFPLI